jgi:hypothetical protein
LKCLKCLKCSWSPILPALSTPPYNRQPGIV